MESEKGRELLSRFKKEVGPADWDKQFEKIADQVNSHYDKTWEKLFEGLKWHSGILGLLLHFLGILRKREKFPKLQNSLRFLIRATPGYRERYNNFQSRVKAEEKAAITMAIPPETKEFRAWRGY